MDAAAEIGRNPVVGKHHINIHSLSLYGDEQADVGRDCSSPYTLRLNRVLTYGIPPDFRGGVHLFI